jgi:hypothetical protein
MEIKLKIEDSYLSTFLALLKKLKYVKVEGIETPKSPKAAVLPTADLNDFQKFLLTGPVMSDDDYDFYVEKRHDFNKWK